MLIAKVKYEPSFEYEVARLFTEQSHVPIYNGCRRLHINRRWPSLCNHNTLRNHNSLAQQEEEDDGFQGQQAQVCRQSLRRRRGGGVHDVEEAKDERDGNGVTSSTDDFYQNQRRK
jgi:hypothetical protein